MNKTQLLQAFGGIHRMMEQKRDYLIELDARNGDGDLGISMDQGFAAAEKAIADSSAASHREKEGQNRKEKRAGLSGSLKKEKRCRPIDLHRAKNEEK